MGCKACQAIETCDAEIIHKSLVDACNNNVSDSAGRSQFLMGTAKKMNQEFTSMAAMGNFFDFYTLSLGVYI